MFVATTEAPGTTRPAGSSTVPLSVLTGPCAQTAAVQRPIMLASRRAIRSFKRTSPQDASQLYNRHHRSKQPRSRRDNQTNSQAEGSASFYLQTTETASALETIAGLHCEI